MLACLARGWANRKRKPCAGASCGHQGRNRSRHRQPACFVVPAWGRQLGPPACIMISWSFSSLPGSLDTLHGAHDGGQLCRRRRPHCSQPPAPTCRMGHGHMQAAARQLGEHLQAGGLPGLRHWRRCTVARQSGGMQP